MYDKIRYQIINLYINVCGIDVGEQYVRMMSKERLNNRLGLLENFEKQVLKLRSILNEKIVTINDNGSIILNDLLMKLDKISICLMKLFDETYNEYEQKCLSDDNNIIINIDDSTNNDYDDDNKIVDQNPETITNQMEHYDIKIDFQYEDLFDDHQDDKYLDLEWKKWFKFSNEMCIKLRIYCVDRFDNELSNEMRNELKQILNIPNDWNKEINQSTKQIDQFIQMIKTLQELWYVVESVHETIMKNGCHDYFIWLCGEFSKILIFHNNATGAKDSFTFDHLFSTKCRIVFFDFCREGIYQGYNDNVRMINSELITKLCRSDFLPKNLVFVCCKYLLKLKKKIHIKCFIRIIQWFDLKLFIHFLMKTYTNESKQKYIRSIFDDIDHIIESKHQSPSNHQLSTKMISTLKQILELKKKLEV